MELTKDTENWLHTNKESYEYFLVNKILHDTSFRVDVLDVVEAVDFSSVAMGAIIAACKNAHTILQLLPNATFPELITWEWLQPYALAANAADDVFDDEDLPIIDQNMVLQQEQSEDQWYMVNAYFKAWLTDSRAKRYATGVQLKNVVNTQDLIDQLQADTLVAENAIYDENEDEYHQALYSTSDKMVERRSTGIPGIDECLGGGLGEGECGLIVAGSGAGKTACCAQMVLHEINTHDGYPLIISTEVKAVQYLTRMISNAMNIDNNEVKDLKNLNQIVGLFSGKQPHKVMLLEPLLEKFRTRMRVMRVDAEQGLTGRQLVEGCVARFERITGHIPTSIHFDWLGDVADSSGAKTSSDRIMMWERAAAGLAKCAEMNDWRIITYAQGTTNIHLVPVPGRECIGISKGIDKKMHWAMCISSLVDKKAAADALLNGEPTKNMTLDDQRFCMFKARNGDTNSVMFRREFKYQRFVSTATAKK